MAKQKLTVTTDAGTFTRTTARTYTHIVVAKGARHEVAEARRQANLQSLRDIVARYRKTLVTGVDPTDRNEYHRAQTARSIADGSYATWIPEYDARIAAAEAVAPITEDIGTTFGLVGWCGRADLAVKLANTEGAQEYRDVRIYALDGTRVR